jgi:exonuclease SbcD
MGFGEAKQQKTVCLVEFSGSAASVQSIDVPVFQKLECVRGDWDQISSRIIELSEAGSAAWLEVMYEGEDVIGDLRDRLEAAVEDSPLEILRVKNSRIIDRVLRNTQEGETLDDLNVNDVFQRCLDAHEVPEDQRPGLCRAYQETVQSLWDG